MCLNYLLTFLGCVLTFSLYAQEPSIETYGNDALSGLTVYDQLMSSDEVLYIATSDGVFAYNSIAFEKLKSPKGVKGKSYFELKENDKQQIFCSNISGQFFKIVDDSLSIFYELPDSLVGSFSYYTTVDDGMIINGKRVLLVDWNGVPSQELEYPFLPQPSDELISVQSVANGDSVRYRIHPKKGHNLPPLFSATVPFEPCVLPLYYSEGCLYYTNNCSDHIFKIDIRSNEYEKVDCKRTLQPGVLIDDERFWAKLIVGGVVEFGADIKDTSGYNYYYQNFYAAPQEATKHGIFLGSDGNGIYQVKNRFLHDFPALNDRNDFLKIIKVLDGKFIMQTKNEVLLLSEDLVARPIFTSGDNISCVYYAEKSKTLLIASKSKLYAYSFETNQLVHNSQSFANIKSLFEVAKDTFLIAGASSIGRFYPGNNILDKNPLMNLRANACLRVGNIDYFATYQGFMAFEAGQKEPSFIKYNGENIFAIKLFEFQNSIIIYSVEHGLLQYIDGEVSPLDIPNVRNENIRDVYFDYPYLSISTKKTIVVQNLESKQQFSFAESNGLQSTNVKHVLIDDDLFYVVTDKGLQRVPLSKMTINDKMPRIRIDKILVNDTPLPKGQQEFEYWQNKMTFELIGNAYGKQKNVQYKYQLSGLSEAWNIQAYYDNTISYQSLPPGSYQLRIIPVYKEKEGEEIRYAFTITPPFWQAWWFYVVLVALGIFSAAFIYRIYSLRRIRKIQLESKINKLRLQAIQSQMNPHFIFNAINAIQESVLDDDRQATYQHINKFSKLVRLTLNFSNEELILLEEEIELLHLYLELEKIRFPDDFEFTIQNSANIYLSIPPMLVQPFVENAILHGLFHKEGEKKLRVSIEAKDHLWITIEDNGIGRAASQKINQKRKKAFEKSFATGAINDRLTILKHRHGAANVNIEFVDLYQENGLPAGTRVQLKLPLIQNL